LLAAWLHTPSWLPAGRLSSGPGHARIPRLAAIESGLSAYDYCYAVLAESIDAPLVTADRRLAAAVANAEFLT
jgi:hypothetical protein